MKKTVNINLGKHPFSIEEDAYKKLDVYLNRIRQQLGSQVDANEVIADIESRIAELFQSHTPESRKVITLENVTEVMRIMGEPDDFIGDHSGGTTGAEGQNSTDSKVAGQSIEKRLFRNPDGKVIAGVCSGLAAYFNLDVALVRILFVLGFFISAGSLVTIAYIVLWIAVPKAVLMEQKMAMHGGFSFNEPNLRRGGASSYDKTGGSPNYQRTKSQKGSQVGLIIKNIAGYLLIIYALTALFAIGIAFTVGYTFAPGLVGFATIDELTRLIVPEGLGLWVYLPAISLVVIPLIFLLYLGIRLVVNFKAYIGAAFALSLFLWFVALGVLVYHSLSVVLGFKHSYHIETSFAVQKQESLFLKLAPEASEPSSIFSFDDDDSYHLMRDAESNRLLILGEPELEAVRGDSLSCKLLVQSSGSSIADAVQNCRRVAYPIEQQGDTLIFPRYYNLGTDAPFRLQRLKVVLTVPVGTKVEVDEKMKDMVDFN